MQNDLRVGKILAKTDKWEFIVKDLINLSEKTIKAYGKQKMSVSENTYKIGEIIYFMALPSDDSSFRIVSSTEIKTSPELSNALSKLEKYL